MRYRFIARGEDGGQKTGFLEATDEAAARQQLMRRKLDLLRLEIDQSTPPPVARQAPPAPPPGRSTGQPPAPPTRPEPSLLGQLDWPKLAGGLTLLCLLLGAGLLLWKRAAGEKDYRIHLTGHLALVSRQELDQEYMGRIQVGLRLKQPQWQIDRDGSVEELGEDGKYHQTPRHFKVQFQMGVEGDYTLDVQTSLPVRPDKLTLFVEAPGFPPKQREVQLLAGGASQELQAQVQPLTLHRLKKRETRAAASTPVTPENSNLPKYNSDAPEPDE